MSAALVADGLVKRYGERTVVSGLSLRCEAGSVLGLLGPNGAGKTTTLRMLYGFLEPDAGRIAYFGDDFATRRDASRRQIGVCTQEDSLDYDLSVEDNLRIYATYFRPGVARLAERVGELLERFGLARYAAASPHALSGGYKRRLMIARSIVHSPRVLFLDEPTTGLDPRARVDVWGLVASMRAEGMAVVLTTHYMDEAERLSNTLVVMSEGQAVADGPPRDVIGAALGEQVLVVRPGDPAEASCRAFVEGRGLPHHQVLDELHVPLATTHLVALRAEVGEVRLRLREPTLDDLFLQLAGRT